MKLISRDYDEVSGITTEYWSHGGKITIRRFQDVEPALVRNQIELNAQSPKARIKPVEGIGTKVASIPMGLVEKLNAEGLNLFTCSDAQLKRFLNDSNYSKIRTARGRV